MQIYPCLLVRYTPSLFLSLFTICLIYFAFAPSRTEFIMTRCKWERWSLVVRWKSTMTTSMEFPAGWATLSKGIPVSCARTLVWRHWPSCPFFVARVAYSYTLENHSGSCTLVLRGKVTRKCGENFLRTINFKRSFTILEIHKGVSRLLKFSMKEFHYFWNSKRKNSTTPEISKEGIPLFLKF